MSRLTRFIAALMALTLGLPALAQDVVEPKIIELMDNMSAYIASLDSWQITAENTSDVRLENDMIAEQANTVSIWADKPDRIRTTERDEVGSTDLFFANGQLTIFRDDVNYYGQVEVPGTIEAAVNFALDEFGIEAPLLDLMHENLSEHFLVAVDWSAYLGLSRVHGVQCHHIALREDETDVQIWISTGDKPLPRKIVIASRHVTGMPRFRSILDWDVAPELGDEIFVFTRPEGAVKIEVQRNQ